MPDENKDTPINNTPSQSNANHYYPYVDHYPKTYSYPNSVLTIQPANQYEHHDKLHCFDIKTHHHKSKSSTPTKNNTSPFKYSPSG